MVSVTVVGGILTQAETILILTGEALSLITTVIQDDGTPTEITIAVTTNRTREGVGGPMTIIAPTATTMTETISRMKI